MPLLFLALICKIVLIALKRFSFRITFFIRVRTTYFGPLKIVKTFHIPIYAIQKIKEIEEAGEPKVSKVGYQRENRGVA
jgi:hypothetical protein